MADDGMIPMTYLLNKDVFKLLGILLLLSASWVGSVYVIRAILH